MSLVPIELFEFLARSIEKTPTPRPCGLATLKEGETHYAALYTSKEGLRVVVREGGPVLVADFFAGATIPVESLPPSVQRRLAEAFDTHRTQFLLFLAKRMTPVEA